MNRFPTSIFMFYDPTAVADEACPLVEFDADNIPPDAKVMSYTRAGGLMTVARKQTLIPVPKAKASPKAKARGKARAR